MQRLTESLLKLSPPGGVCNETVVSNLFPGKSVGALRLLVHRAVAAGELIRLKPGVWILADVYNHQPCHPFVLASLLLAPSHISLESALAYHGLIPEAVFQVASVANVRSRTFTTSVGVFSFQRVVMRNPRVGVEARKLGDQQWAFIASALRAITDMIYLNQGIEWEHDGVDYLTESLRIEAEDLAALPLQLFDPIIASLRCRRTKFYLEGLREVVKNEL